MNRNKKKENMNITLDDLFISSYTIFNMPEGLEKLEATEKHLHNKYAFYEEEYNYANEYTNTIATSDAKKELVTILELTCLAIMDVRDKILDFKEKTINN